MLTLLQLVVPNADKGQQNGAQQQTATDDTDVPIKANQQRSVPHISTASGLTYAVSDKAKDKSDTIKDQEVCNNMLISISTM